MAEIRHDYLSPLPHTAIISKDGITLYYPTSWLIKRCEFFRFDEKVKDMDFFTIEVDFLAKDIRAFLDYLESATILPVLTDNIGLVKVANFFNYDNYNSEIQGRIECVYIFMGQLCTIFSQDISGMDLMDVIQSVGLDRGEWDSVLYCIEHWTEIRKDTKKWSVNVEKMSDSDTD